MAPERELREALALTQWAECDGYENRCPVCKSPERLGHNANCVVGAALAVAPAPTLSDHCNCAEEYAGPNCAKWPKCQSTAPTPAQPNDVPCPENERNATTAEESGIRSAGNSAEPAVPEREPLTEAQVSAALGIVTSGVWSQSVTHELTKRLNSTLAEAPPPASLRAEEETDT